MSLHAPSAFPIAQVAVEISTNVVEFPSVLMSALIKRCCFAVPRYPKRISTNEAFKIELGYLSVDGVVKESDSAFIERMSGLISFYAAIVQTNSLTGINSRFFNVLFIIFRKTERHRAQYGLDLVSNNTKFTTSTYYPLFDCIVP